MVDFVKFGVATFEALFPGVATFGTLAPTLATDCLLFFPFTMALEAVLTAFAPAGVALAFLALFPPETWTLPGADELDPLSLRKLAPFSDLAMLLRSTVLVDPALNPY
jgi:hypothetical protein